MNLAELAVAIKEQARQLGFLLVGITTPEPSQHIETYKRWVQAGLHGEMQYLAEERAIQRRADPRLILPECRAILVLGVPYDNPLLAPMPPEDSPSTGRIAAYAWGDDYHLVLPSRLQAMVHFIEERVGHPVPNRWYTDTGHLLERELAQRAGLGWIGKNTCLISPRHGSYFLLAEILLGLDLPADSSFTTDHCGTCTRCIQACPTQCIQPDRTLDARRCISYWTIENKGEIPPDIRPLLGNWVFGCDICQMVCPWNLRFAPAHGDPAFAPRESVPLPVLAQDLTLTAEAFNRKFKRSPVKRAKRRGYLRNVAVAAGNTRAADCFIPLREIEQNEEKLIGEHARWALKQIGE
ncbi:MAG: tRNA epoxyqueuosine(34) reductase QueG [Anaerolineae bacterium]|nr:MAG: tRNA epoxyqueuosine(34) reductase QueG [Anaerolineae bacterium]